MARFGRRVNLASEEFLPPRLIALIKDPRPVLEVVGMLLASESREAWKRKQYGGIAWPKQYDGMVEFIHVAGAIRDLERGASIKKRRFTRHEPPLVDTGLLRNSISHRIVSKNVVEAGAIKNVIDYAGLQNTGGKSPSIKIEGTPIRKNLFMVMRASADDGAKKSKLRQLGFLFSVASYDQDIAPRPFIGVTSRARQMIPKVVKAIFEGRPIEQV